MRPNLRMNIFHNTAPKRCYTPPVSPLWRDRAMGFQPPPPTSPLASTAAGGGVCPSVFLVALA